MRISGCDRDRFWVNLNTGTIEWLHYENGEPLGGQFALREFTQDDFAEAMVHFPKGPIEQIFAYVGEHCSRYRAVAGTPFYRHCVNKFMHEALASGTTIETFDAINELLLSADLINAYCKKEFGSKADFSNLEKVGLANTTTEDGYHEIQSYANLKEYRIETYFNNELIVTQNFKSLEEMNEKCLTSLSFNELVDVPEFAVEDWEQNARAEDLAVRLTVFISEVDPYTFSDSLEAGEGIKEAIAKTREQLKDPVCISEIICELQQMADECGLKNADLYKCYDLMYDLHHLYNDSFNIPVYDREMVILDNIFEAVGVEYKIGFDEIGLKVSDGEHTWHDAQFFRWFNENVLTVDKCRELERTHFMVYSDYKELSEHNGVRVGTRIKKKEEMDTR